MYGFQKRTLVAPSLKWTAIVFLTLAVFAGIFFFIKSIRQKNIKHADTSFGFGFLADPVDDYTDYTYANDVGFTHTRYGFGFIWNWIDVNRDGSFSFKKATIPPKAKFPDMENTVKNGLLNYDNEVLLLLKNKNIKLVKNIYPFIGGVNSFFPDTSEFANENEMEIYKNFVKNAAERYDGDADFGCTEKAPDCYKKGDNEYPEQSLITATQENPIKYWQVANRLDEFCLGNTVQTTQSCVRSGEYVEKYATAYKATYESIKSVCQDCQVIMAGDSSPDEYAPVFNKLKMLKGKIDDIDFHYYGLADDYIEVFKMKSMIEKLLENSGFDPATITFWITETGTHVAKGMRANLMGDHEAMSPLQTEQDQATSLVKRFVTAYGEGVKNVFWALGIEEQGCECCSFETMGLMYDGKEMPLCPDLGKGKKKLSYYSLKKMIEMIKDFNNIIKIEAGYDIKTNKNLGNYIYLLKNNDNKNMWIAWSENGGGITLDNITSKSVSITQSVPNYATGSEVVKFETAFKTEIKKVTDGKIYINLTNMPVFIETIDLNTAP